MVSSDVEGTLCEAPQYLPRAVLDCLPYRLVLPGAFPGFLDKAWVTEVPSLGAPLFLSPSPRTALAYAINTQFVSGNGPSSCFECLLSLAKLSIQKMDCPEEGLFSCSP